MKKRISALMAVLFLALGSIAFAEDAVNVGEVVIPEGITMTQARDVATRRSSDANGR